jgi:hypothetical protein
VEVICPYDVVFKGGIPDYTIAGLLRRLQHERGDNIVGYRMWDSPDITAHVFL